MAKRARVVAVAVVLVVLAVGWWATHRHRGETRSPGASSPTAAPTPTGPARARADDPRTRPRAAIAGVVREVGGGPLAGAQVCARIGGADASDEERREPRCTTTDATGHYRLDDLLPVEHLLSAAAAGHEPRTWRDPQRDRLGVTLAPGEQRTGVDFALRPGGVAISGTVEDVGGGPIAGALVSTRGRFAWGLATSFTRTDDRGAFTVWAAAGVTTVAAGADGYTDGTVDVAAPDQGVVLYLTPEASLSGTVVTADDHRPVAGALVDSGWSFEAHAATRTDEAGRFRLTHLAPGRYKPTATGDGWYGEPAESVLLGLGQSVDGVEIVVAPAHAARGVVTIDGATPTPCPAGVVSLHDARSGRDGRSPIDADGRFAVAPLRAGHYQVRVACDDHVSRDRYPAVDIVDRDVDGLAYQVSAGAAVRGRVTGADGAPIADAMVSLRLTGGDPRGRRDSGGATTDDDGGYRATGLAAGTYTIDVWSPRGGTPRPAPTVDVPATGEVTRDVVLAATGDVAGTVVDPAGRPVARARVRVTGASSPFSGATLSASDGTFVLIGVEPGARRVIASRGWGEELRRPGSTDDDRQGEAVTVAAGRRAVVRLVVEAEDGAIAGVVRDDRGQPVPDAWLAATRESDSAGRAPGGALRASRWTWRTDMRPVVTGVDGRFAIDHLAAGRYTLRAYRKGGGEAVAEHVDVGATDVALVIATTGSIAGTVTGPAGQPPDEFMVTVTDRTTGVDRDESFYRTGGSFAIRDLPAGHFQVTAVAAGSRAETTLDLAAGQHRTGVALALVGNLKVTGRLVDLDTGAPVAGLRTSAAALTGNTAAVFLGDDGEAKERISGADGRFVIDDAPRGRVWIAARVVDRAQPYAFTRWLVEIGAGDTVDIGDVPVPRRRLEMGEPAGDLGLSYRDAPPDQDPRQRVFEVAHVDADGPAARAGVVVGDVVTAVDGHDVRGQRASLLGPLTRVKVGTAVRLGLARGVEVTVTAVAP